MTDLLTRPSPGPRNRPRPSPRPVKGPAPELAILDQAQRGAYLPGWLIAEQLARIPGPISRLLPDRDRYWNPTRWRLFALASTLLTLTVRAWGSARSVDLFIDEPFYAQVGNSIAQGHMPFATGAPFFLHPPAFFVLEAGWMRIFGQHSDVFAQVFSLRKLVAVIAAATALILAVLVRKLAGPTVAAIVVVLYVVNAFIANQSTIVILEPSTMMWTLAGYAVFAHLRPLGARSVGGITRHRQVLAAGLLFGIANLSKEFAVFVTILPLVFALVLRCWITRREAVLAIAMACVPWIGWLIVVFSTGYGSDFITQVTAGFHRTTGKTQISGFNSKDAPSFLDAIIANLDTLWTSYAILGLGSLAIVYVAWTHRGNPRLRFFSMFGLGAILLLGYCVTLGTNEEQFFNFLFFPALICLVTVAWTEWRRIGRVLRWGLLVLLAAGIVSDSAEYVAIHTTPEDGTYRVNQWMAGNVAAGTAVGTTNPVQRQVLLRYNMIDDASNTTLDPKVRYLIVFYKQVDQGYAFVDRDTIDRQVRGQREVFSFTDAANGKMAIYAID